MYNISDITQFCLLVIGYINFIFHIITQWCAKTKSNVNLCFHNFPNVLFYLDLDKYYYVLFKIYISMYIVSIHLVKKVRKIPPIHFEHAVREFFFFLHWTKILTWRWSYRTIYKLYFILCRMMIKVVFLGMMAACAMAQCKYL